MYATCLFCGGSLERNESIEHFPVGRRLAYDPAKGRLWVVCRRCERWNLTPLETRWEAIEEAERHFRATRLRVSTDNIALAQLRDGLELVRVGAPPRLEFAAWRYGDQFGRRRRRYLLTSGVGTGAVFGAMATQFSGALLLPSLAIWGSAATLALSATQRVWRRRDNQARFAIRDHRAALVALTPLNARCAALIGGEHGEAWRLKVPYGKWKLWRPGPAIRPDAPEGFDGQVVLTGDPALRALSVMLPYLNRGGGSVRRIREAVDVVNESPDLTQLVSTAAVNDEASRTHFKIRRGESNIGALPARIRLALEMALHEGDECRAMDGERDTLEDRWREAETIASIADSLTLPADIDERLRRLRAT